LKNYLYSRNGLLSNPSKVIERNNEKYKRKEERKMIKKWQRLILTITLAFLVVAAISCAGLTQTTALTPNVSKYPLEIVDRMDRVVTVPTKPGRIISLSTSNTEILFALGAGNSVVGVDDSSKQDLEENISELQEISAVGSYVQINVEKVVELQPDLVLAVPYQKQTIERLETLGLPVVVLEATSIESVLTTIELIGTIIDREEEASILLSSLRQRLENIKKKTSELIEKPTVLYLYEPLWIAGSGTMADDLLQIGGGVNIFSEVDGAKEVDMETIISRDPQVIFCVQGYAATLEYIMGETRLNGVAAIKNGRVYGIQANLVDIPGPRIIDALELIARYLHPELFEE
jgi:iron complex transport system substrate-binding protein